MKKVFLVLPLAIMLANCSSTRNANNSSASSGVNASSGSAGMSTDASTSGSVASSDANSSMSAGASNNSTTGNATGSGSMSSSSSAGTGTTSSMGSTNSVSSTSGNTANWSSNNNATTNPGTAVNNSSPSTKSPSGSINWDVYDPNNYMQNPDKYLRPFEMTKTGGWTYNKDWRRNTNFTADAVGQWQLILTPEVAANWMPDTRRPETYASFWTPEAVMARYQANLAAITKTQDSLAALNAIAEANAMSKSGRKNSSKYKRSGAGMNSSSDMNGSTNETNNSGTTGMTGSVATSGSGTTGAMGTGGSASMNTTPSSDSSNANGVTTPFVMTAVNGNNFMLPTLNMYIDNGSFTAYTGCNSAVGTIIVNGSALKFQEATPSTNVECIGGFDQSAFIDKLRRADSYDVVNNQFRLKQGDQVLMIFQKNGQK